MKRFRKTFRKGAVTMIPVEGQGFVYCCFVNNGTAWFYDFITDKPVRSDYPFPKSSWHWPADVFAITGDAVDIATVEVAEGNEDCPVTYIFIPDRGPPYHDPMYPPRERPYRCFHPDTKYFAVGESELSDKFPSVNIIQNNPDETLEVFLAERLPQMERRILTPEETADPAKKRMGAPPPPKEEEPQDLNVRILIPVDYLPIEHPDELEEALMEAFEENGLAEVSAAGVWPDGMTDFCLEVPPKNWNRALKTLRRILQKQKFPPEHTVIRICGEDGAPDRDFTI